MYSLRVFNFILPNADISLAKIVIESKVHY